MEKNLYEAFQTSNDVIFADLAEPIEKIFRKHCSEMSEFDLLDKNVNKNKLNLYTIVYEEIPNMTDQFECLDNYSNERPDWREYWPIRNFIISNSIKDNEYYGFFSPKFFDKTGLNKEQVLNFCRKNIGNYDVISFSPQYDQSVIFKNVFDQGNYHHPGLYQAAVIFLNEIGEDLEVLNKLSVVENSIFSNYFVASGRFIREWFNLTEKLFQICEELKSRAGQILTKKDSYMDQNLEFKVFVMERVCAYVLDRGAFTCRRYPPLKMGFPTIWLDSVEKLLRASNLKAIFSKTQNYEILKAYNRTSIDLIGLWERKLTDMFETNRS